MLKSDSWQPLMMSAVTNMNKKRVINITEAFKLSRSILKPINETQPPKKK